MSMLVLRRLLMGLMLVLVGPAAQGPSWILAMEGCGLFPRVAFLIMSLTLLHLSSLVPRGLSPHVFLQTPYPVEFVQQRKQKKLAQSRAILFKVTPLDQDITYTNGRGLFILTPINLQAII
jgi:hypothetical protein